MGALTRIGDKRHHNHYNTIAEALSIALPGDTIELADGHYWVDSPGLLIDKPIKLVGDENNAANVVIEMSGSVEWKARRGWIEGITFRRPKISTGLPVSLPMLKMTDEANVDMFRCVFDNDSSSGPVTTLSGTGSKGRWTDVVVRNGGSPTSFQSTIPQRDHGTGSRIRLKGAKCVKPLFSDRVRADHYEVTRAFAS